MTLFTALTSFLSLFFIVARRSMSDNNFSHSTRSCFSPKTSLRDIDFR